MNPLALFLLAAAAGGRRMPGGFDRSPAEAAPIKLDTLVSQLQGAVNTLEKVSELSRMGSNLNSSMAAPASLSAPASGHIPVSAEVIQGTRETSAPQPAPPAFPGFDLQSAMQTLGPLLSMLGNNQPAK